MRCDAVVWLIGVCRERKAQTGAAKKKNKERAKGGGRRQRVRRFSTKARACMKNISPNDMVTYHEQSNQSSWIQGGGKARVKVNACVCLGMLVGLGRRLQWVYFFSGIFDSIRFDAMRRDSVRCGSVRFGSVRFDPIRCVTAVSCICINTSEGMFVGLKLERTGADEGQICVHTKGRRWSRDARTGSVWADQTYSPKLNSSFSARHPAREAP